MEMIKIKTLDIGADALIYENKRKDFPNYLNVFSEAVSKSQRTPLKVWNNNSNEYNDITPFDHQKFVSDYLSDKSPYRGLLL